MWKPGTAWPSSQLRLSQGWNYGVSWAWFGDLADEESALRLAQVVDIIQFLVVVELRSLVFLVDVNPKSLSIFRSHSPVSPSIFKTSSREPYWYWVPFLLSIFSSGWVYMIQSDSAGNLPVLALPYNMTRSKEWFSYHSHYDMWLILTQVLRIMLGVCTRAGMLEATIEFCPLQTKSLRAEIV